MVDRYADDTTLMAESEEELKSLLMKVKVESKKVGFNLAKSQRREMCSVQKEQDMQQLCHPKVF